MDDSLTRRETTTFDDDTNGIRVSSTNKIEVEGDRSSLYLSWFPYFTVSDGNLVAASLRNLRVIFFESYDKLTTRRDKNLRTTR